MQNNSLFLDEGLVVLNLFEKQYFQLFLPLDYNQAAPPFFLIISKLAFESFGVNELALRFFPYLTSILSLGFFYLLSKKIFDKYTTVLVCFFVFAINPQLIWMSQNLKPYISDVMFTTIALLIAVSININHLDKKKSFFIGLSSAVCLWFSYAVLFVISAFSFVFAAEVFSGKNKSTENKQKFIIYLIPNVISFVIYFLTNLLWVKQNNFLHKFWSTVYAFAPHSLNDFIKVFGFLFEHFNFYLIVFLFFFGLYFLYKKNEVQLWIFLFPILLALWCAYCGIYPFADRLVLYLLPVFLIVIFMPLDKISFDKKLYSTFLIIVYFLLITPVCKYFVLPVVQNKISFAFADTREGYLKLVKEVKPTDFIYVYFYNMGSFRAYNLKYKIPENQIKYGRWGSDNYKKYTKELQKLPKNRILWIVLLDENYTKNEVAAITDWVSTNCVVLNKSIIGKTILIKARKNQ